MKRYIIIALSFLAWSMFAFGAEVKVENASLARSGDSLKIDFKIVVPQGTVGSDYLQRMVLYKSYLQMFVLTLFHIYLHN